MHLKIRVDMDIFIAMSRNLGKTINMWMDRDTSMGTDMGTAIDRNLNAEVDVDMCMDTGMHMDIHIDAGIGMDMDIQRHDHLPVIATVMAIRMDMFMDTDVATGPQTDVNGSST